ncbi:restriction endonuclease subunit S [Psychrobacter lutiphocae]|uniref:restriction endonuclease subunit S n=1 Tax=Psychrobacter lutiphocae TaxID=540500 RepID=UPI000363992F|nr:restriction endonuclease subunit S [Psychrobacter lutiphocae]
MVSNWASVTLGDLVEIKYGKDHKKLDDGVIPCMGSGGIMRYVDRSLYDQESILIPRKGSLNNIYYVDEPFWTVDTLFWTKINSEAVDPKFLFYQLKLVDFVSMNVGSAVPSLTVPVLNDLSIKLPPLAEQKAIAYILGTLDDKIEINRQINETLEAMAQAVFKSWFVDFDPVIDKALRAGKAIPEPLKERAELRQAQLDSGKAKTNSEINDLFPSEFEFTEELGWIPRGWNVGQFSNLAKLNPESWSKKNIPNEILYVDLGNTNNGKIDSVTPYSSVDAPSRAKRVLAVDDTIIGTVRPGNRSFAYIHNDGLTGSTGFAVMRPLETRNRSYIYFGLTQDKVIDYFSSIASGSAYPAINSSVVADLECVIPPATLLESFDTKAYAFINKVGMNNNYNETLTKLRDTLLPKLMSGELRIKDAETLVKEVL